MSDDMKVLPVDDPGSLKLGWVVYEELWPIVNEGFKDMRWFDGSTEKFHLKKQITDRVSGLLFDIRKNGYPKLGSDIWFETCFLCRDMCDDEREIGEWEIPIDALIIRLKERSKNSEEITEDIEMLIQYQDRREKHG